MQTVFDKNGNPVTVNNPVDARERVACGLAWATADAARAANPVDVAPAPTVAGLAAVAGGAELTVKELREWLTTNKVDFPSTANKAELAALYDAAHVSQA